MSARDGTRQEMDASEPGTAAALTPRVGDPQGCGDGKSHAGPDESSGAHFPKGWQLGAESWAFHRQFYARVGRPTTQGEYAAIISQIRYRIAPKLARYHYQVTLLDGSPLIVSGNWQRLTTVEPADWTPPPVKALAPPPKAKPPARAPPTPIAIAEPPLPQPLRASTLTLGNPAAARAVAERLRRAGIPVGRSSP